MKRYAAYLMVLFCGALGVLAQGLDDEYVQIFKMIQEGDTLSNTAPGQALAKYLDAQAALDSLHKGSPDWNKRIVDYRLSYLAERIAALSATTSVPPRTPTQEEKPAAPSAPGAQPGPPAAPADWQAQIASLQQSVGQLQADRQLLQAKLKEALAVRPAAAEPGELAKAEDRIRALQKENELLKATVEKPKLAEAVDSKALEGAQRQLADANRQISEQSSRLSKLALENQALQSRIKSSGSEDPALTAVRAENELLKRQLAQLSASTAIPGKVPDNGRQLTELQSQLSKVQSDKETLRLENIALENRIKQLSAGSVATTSAAASAAPGDNAQVKQLEDERDTLQKRLEVAIAREKPSRKLKGSAQTKELERELALARTRLEVFDARAVPYTPEELALLRRPETKLQSDANSGKKSIRELPAGAAAFVAEAQRCFAAKQYDKAEAAYLEVLKQDPKNVPTLANLAAIQLEEQAFDRAEPNIRLALAQDPDDAYSLYILGILKFRQAKYDEALDALSHSAKLDPQNAEVQNYLGLALSEKGMRVPAETALRRAVQLQPGYAGAHYNLAVVYATEKPPAMELARWHYQKALAAGHPPNPDLERRFEARP